MEILTMMWLGGVAVGRRIRDREVASSIPGCSAARCNSGQVVHTRVPLFTKQYKLVPASAGGKSAPREWCWVCWQPFGGPYGWRPTGTTPASFLPVVAVVQRP